MQKGTPALAGASVLQSENARQLEASGPPPECATVHEVAEVEENLQQRREVLCLLHLQSRRPQQLQLRLQLRHLRRKLVLEEHGGEAVLKSGDGVDGEEEGLGRAEDGVGVLLLVGLEHVHLLGSGRELDELAEGGGLEEVGVHGDDGVADLLVGGLHGGEEDGDVLGAAGVEERHGLLRCLLLLSLSLLALFLCLLRHCSAEESLELLRGQLYVIRGLCHCEHGASSLVGRNLLPLQSLQLNRGQFVTALRQQLRCLPSHHRRRRRHS
mmetsp:Transcript_21463/g.83246  ORF Transcript_21463/g.83246 Transcript_21463/m.83246 type:complete len:269 (-) Transcript_21463:130-936(-)